MKLFIITKKQITTLLVLVLGIAVAVIGSVTISAGTERLLPIYCVETDKKQIAISFDAAWGNDDTEQLIKILGEYKVPATFFVVGAWVDKYPEEVKRLSEAGHDVMNHSNTHPYMTSLSSERMVAELNACNDKIEAITGKKPTLFRCPYGDYNNSVVSTVESIGMKTIQWDVETLATKVIV